MAFRVRVYLLRRRIDVYKQYLCRFLHMYNTHWVLAKESGSFFHTHSSLHLLAARCLFFDISAPLMLIFCQLNWKGKGVI